MLEGVETKSARMAILAGIRVQDDSEEEDPARLLAVTGLKSYVSPLAAKLLGIQAVTWERVQHETGVDQVMAQLVKMVMEVFRMQNLLL